MSGSNTGFKSKDMSYQIPTYQNNVAPQSNFWASYGNPGKEPPLFPVINPDKSFPWNRLDSSTVKRKGRPPIYPKVIARSPDQDSSNLTNMGILNQGNLPKPEQSQSKSKDIGQSRSAAPQWSDN
jgi:hypothetical protein